MIFFKLLIMIKFMTDNKFKIIIKQNNIIMIIYKIKNKFIIN
jgi:hypothetical protein